jgi:hypothetical protein
VGRASGQVRDGGPVATPAARSRSAAGARRRPSRRHCWPPAETRLASYVGPIAACCSRRAAKEAPDTVALVDRLALHIDDPAKRAAFLRALDDL